jgi:hypothetical protein
MAKGYLPDEAHVVRHVPAQLVSRDPNTEAVIGCFPQAFQLRPDEEYLSTSWLEFYLGSFLECTAAVAAAMSKTRKIGPSHGLAIGNVGRIKAACDEFSLKIRVIHEPDDDNPSYTAVRRFKSDNIELLELLANEAWSHIVEVKQVREMYGPWPCRQIKA